MVTQWDLVHSRVGIFLAHVVDVWSIKNPTGVSLIISSIIIEEMVREPGQDS